ncbi:hypothetical protein G9P44_003728 [Scheffersomyces stipitis]|nr:hypothetical protein G9P44_003728 [Scheffersomyces stipitis]
MNLFILSLFLFSLQSLGHPVISGDDSSDSSLNSESLDSNRTYVTTADDAAIEGVMIPWTYQQYIDSGGIVPNDLNHAELLAQSLSESETSASSANSYQTVDPIATAAAADMLACYQEIVKLISVIL